MINHDNSNDYEGDVGDFVCYDDYNDGHDATIVAKVLGHFALFYFALHFHPPPPPKLCCFSLEVHAVVETFHVRNNE